MTKYLPIPDDRPLTNDEGTLAEWLLTHGRPDAVQYLPQLAEARVVSRCHCGCASIDFIDTRKSIPGFRGLDLLSDYHWRDAESRLGGVFIFAVVDMLAGIEVWSVDGSDVNLLMPKPEQLLPND